jgi:hypothetical protein
MSSRIFFDPNKFEVSLLGCINEKFRLADSIMQNSTRHVSSRIQNAKMISLSREKAAKKSPPSVALCQRHPRIGRAAANR